MAIRTNSKWASGVQRDSSRQPGHKKKATTMKRPGSGKQHDQHLRATLLPGEIQAIDHCQAHAKHVRTNLANLRGSEPLPFALISGGIQKRRHMRHSSVTDAPALLFIRFPDLSICARGDSHQLHNMIKSRISSLLGTVVPPTCRPTRGLLPR